jgi:fumarate hydratase class II
MRRLDSRRVPLPRSRSAPGCHSLKLATTSNCVEQSLAMGTALAPEIGYEKAAALVPDAFATGRTIREVAREKSGIPEERLNGLIDPRMQVG